MLSIELAADDMKTFLAFLLGLIAGGLIAAAVITHKPQIAAQSPSSAPSAESESPKAKDAIAQKLEQWKLTPQDIRSDLAKTGEVVRTKAAATGKKLADARVVAVIKAKYVLDANLSALDIGVECHSGEVMLTGKVNSPELIGRAIMLALDTNGVHHVVSKLAVSSTR